MDTTGCFRRGLASWHEFRAKIIPKALRPTEVKREKVECPLFLAGASAITYTPSSPEWSGTGNNVGINLEAKLEEGKKVVVGTKDDATSPLHGDHAYVVLDIFDDGGTRRARLYNPWGEEETVALSDLWLNINAIYIQ